MTAHVDNYPLEDGGSCEKCGKSNEGLYALENRGKIYKWVCATCYFNWIKSKKKKEAGKRELNS